MAKLCFKKKSKRISCRTRYKVEKKVREHNRKLRREAKKNPKKSKKKVVQIPNMCPFKEDILKEVEALKREREEEKARLREEARAQRKREKEQQQSGDLQALVQDAQTKQALHDVATADAGKVEATSKPDSSVKSYCKEFRKVLEAADVVLEVIDARDPLGTRCKQVEEAVALAGGNKRLVLVLNKSDLVPRDNLQLWLKYLRRRWPTVPFKASTQQQSRRLGRRNMKKAAGSAPVQGSVCVGAELLMSVLANYCRNKGIKTSITVGVVGLPNVGKSSIINSLKRSRACNVGATPGVTKNMQVVQLDSKIKLLDSPGVVFARASSDWDSTVVLKNAVRVGAIVDLITPATAILQRANKEQLMELYDLPNFSTHEEFLAFRARRMGQFKKSGVPNIHAAARSLIEDWNKGKIKYYTVPPEDDSEVHISAAIVGEAAAEFDVASFEAMETEMLGSLKAQQPNAESRMLEVSAGEMFTAREVLHVGGPTKIIPDSVEVDATVSEKKKKQRWRKNKVKGVEKDKKMEALMSLEGNQKLNQLKKLELKKIKKEKAKKVRQETQLAGTLESLSLAKGDSYDFVMDYTT
ncbi:guanine nucleotide-binding protein-like 3 homolog [Bacillus rossius redtenbacheri]|uniref:guanine nucleotide-binding protein-like 3 homolog n=1 Tax=Bacillus rossius redtenbacheri TaxID=93214 RepID=UPI002FDDE70F